MIISNWLAPASRQIAVRLGVSESTAHTAVQIAVPLIVSALARNASQPEGAQALHQAFTNDHDGGILDNIGSYLGNPEQGNGAGILGHVLGDQRGVVENNLSQATGMDQSSAGNLMELIAPPLSPEDGGRRGNGDRSAGKHEAETRQDLLPRKCSHDPLDDL